MVLPFFQGDIYTFLYLVEPKRKFSGVQGEGGITRTAGKGMCEGVWG
jgi:hypothetical protein